ncbi:hypothetical protein BURMUCGD1_0693 [Burkholderia multivorans CGD1]|nr:hypothetical protein BURMUCGD1_0693 [Burkholderia multivorans CGD1]
MPRAIITARPYRDARAPVERRYVAVQPAHHGARRTRRMAIPIYWAPPHARRSPNRQFFTMRKESLRYKNSWCMAQIPRFAMPKNVPQYKTKRVSVCFYARIFLSSRRSTRTIRAVAGRRLCSMH